MGCNSSKVPKKLEKVLIVSRRDSLDVKKNLATAGFELVKKNPDFIICYGGDGTVLFSERKFPGVPKLIIKSSRACRIDRSFMDIKAATSLLFLRRIILSPPKATLLMAFARSPRSWDDVRYVIKTSFLYFVHLIQNVQYVQ